MKFKEDGFRPLYHYVCAFELNDKLRELIKDCPEAAKSSHAVAYGYIDPKKGLMLEILGGGKQAPKYFYFKEPYEGKRITISVSEVADVEFVFFPELENRFYKKYAPRIEALKKYDVSENLEKSRKFDFLDGLRDPIRPDDIKVTFVKEGLEPEDVMVRLTDLGDHFFIGKVLKQPKQDFGRNKGDEVKFGASQEDDNTIKCIASFESHKPSKAAFEDGSVLKNAIEEFNKNKSEDTFGFAIAVLRSSMVYVPCDAELNDEAKAIIERLDSEGKSLDDLSEEEHDKFNEGLKLVPNTLSNGEHSFFPVFSTEDEIGDKLESTSKVKLPFIQALNSAENNPDNRLAIFVNLGICKTSNPFRNGKKMEFMTVSKRIFQFCDIARHDRFNRSVQGQIQKHIMSAQVKQLTFPKLLLACNGMPLGG